MRQLGAQLGARDVPDNQPQAYALGLADLIKPHASAWGSAWGMRCSRQSAPGLRAGACGFDKAPCVSLGLSWACDVPDNQPQAYALGLADLIKPHASAWGSAWGLRCSRQSAPGLRAGACGFDKAPCVSLGLSLGLAMFPTTAPGLRAGACGFDKAPCVSLGLSLGLAMFPQSAPGLRAGACGFDKAPCVSLGLSLGLAIFPKQPQAYALGLADFDKAPCVSLGPARCSVIAPGLRTGACGFVIKPHASAWGSAWGCDVPDNQPQAYALGLADLIKPHASAWG